MIDKFIVWCLKKKLDNIKYSLFSLKFDTSIRDVSNEEWEKLKSNIDKLRRLKVALQQVINYLEGV